MGAETAVADGPVWLRVVVRAERALGEPLTRVTNSLEGAAILLAAGRGSQLVRDGAGRARAALVHALALPSHRDLERLDAKGRAPPAHARGLVSGATRA